MWLPPWEQYKIKLSLDYLVRVHNKKQLPINTTHKNDMPAAISHLFPNCAPYKECHLYNHSATSTIPGVIYTTSPALQAVSKSIVPTITPKQKPISHKHNTTTAKFHTTPVITPHKECYCFTYPTTRQTIAQYIMIHITKIFEQKFKAASCEAARIFTTKATTTLFKINHKHI